MAASTESARLRVVGQELEQKKISDFDVFVEEGGYRVRGYVPPAPPKVVAPPKRKLSDLFKPKPAVIPEPAPEPEEWEQSYSRADIDRLDDLHQAQRRGTGAPDPYALSQVLRVVGAYVEDRRWV